MGFGWMFLGVFFFWSAKLAGFDLLPDFCGYLLILKGIKVSLKYCNNFKTARAAGIVGAVVSVPVMLVQAFELLGLDIDLTSIGDMIQAANQAARIVFLMILLMGVFSLARTTGAEKAEKRSLIALIVTPVLWLGYIGLTAYGYFAENVDEKLYSVILLCEIIYVVIAAIGVFSAYVWICVEGDEDMPKHGGARSPMDYYDCRREREAREEEEDRKRRAAEKAGKTMAQMYGVKKKKKGK